MATIKCTADLHFHEPRWWIASSEIGVLDVVEGGLRIVECAKGVSDLAYALRPSDNRRLNY